MSDQKRMDDEAIEKLVTSTMAEVDAGLSLAEWADDEIEHAIKEHPEAENDLFHAFKLVRPTMISGAWGTEFVFRGHARELLERVASGEDTRPGTAAECCLAMSKVSQELPLHGAAAGFYFRMWEQAFPGHVVDAGITGHHEALYRQQIDDHERYVRNKLRQPRRHLGALEIGCQGEHWASRWRAGTASASPTTRKGTRRECDLLQVPVLRRRRDGRPAGLRGLPHGRLRADRQPRRNELVGLPARAR